MKKLFWGLAAASLAVTGCGQVQEETAGEQQAASEAMLATQPERCVADADQAPASKARTASTAEMQAIKARRAAGGGKAIRVPVAFHVIHDSTGAGNLPESQLDEQIRVLNQDFRASGFSFYKVSVDRTRSDTWFAMGYGGNEHYAKRKLAVDPANVLNFYTAELGMGLLGWAYLPWSFDESHYMHGVVVHHRSLPGGSFTNYNGGQTATHEIGHYLGLYHTFDGGCSVTGDYCDDTPAEAAPARGCPVGSDTCSAPGLDPIHNYMDYSYDACMYEFSPDQGARMEWALTTYKPSLAD